MADIDKIKGSFYIYSNGEYVVLPGSKLYILKTDGSLVACRKDLRHAGRITFLTGNRMLLCSSKAFFHMINLCDGSDIWTAPYVKHNLNVNNLAISSDEAFAYTYDDFKGMRFISRLFLTTQEHEVDTQVMDMDIGATLGILCDAEGVPCLLKTLTETIGGRIVYQSGVRIHDFDGIAPGGTTTWKTKWSSESSASSCFYDRVDRILTADLKVYNSTTGEIFDLLENEFSLQLPSGQGTLSCWLDVTGRYLSMQYQTANVIIDTQERKIVAQYASPCRGCLIHNEYWVCVDDRICRKPFPLFEDAPPLKPVFGWGVNYSKHPELW